jgi:hypothetical protein
MDLITIPTWKTFTEGDTNAVLYFALQDEDGSALDLSGKTVLLEGRKRRASAEFSPVSASVTTAATGEGEVSCSSLSAAKGEYRCQIRVTGSGFYRTYPGKIVIRGEARAGEA